MALSAVKRPSAYFSVTFDRKPLALTFGDNSDIWWHVLVYRIQVNSCNLSTIGLLYMRNGIQGLVYRCMLPNVAIKELFEGPMSLEQNIV